MNELDVFLKDFYDKYAPGTYSPEKLQYIKDNYGNDVDSLIVDLYDKYAGGGGADKLDYIKSNYKLSENSLTAHQKALLDTISDVESPDYNVITGGKRFQGYDQHPNIVGVVTPAGPSTAAGKYQITKSTWDRIQAKLHLPDFSPESQDKAAIWLAQDDYRRRTNRELDEDLQSNDPAVLENIRKTLSPTWKGLAKDKTFVNRYQPRVQGLVESMGSAQDPMGSAGVTFAQDVDPSKFDQKTLDELYIKAGGTPGEAYETDIKHDDDTFLGMFKTNRYNISFKDKEGVKSTKYLDRNNAGVIDRFDAALVNVGIQTVSGLASLAGAAIGVTEDAIEAVLTGDTNFDKTMDYADNAVNDYLNTQKSKQITNASMLSIEEKAKIAEENKGAFAGLVASLSKLGESQYWEQEGADMLGSQLAFGGLGLAARGAIKGTELGIGLTKVLTKVPLVSEKVAEKIVTIGTGTVLNSSAEAVQEASLAYKDIKQQLLDKGLSEEEATKQASDAASEIFGTNFMMLLATNFIELQGLTDGISTSKHAFVRGVINTLVLGISEGVQESFQTGATDYSTEKALKQPYNEGKNTGVFDSLFGDGDSALGGTLSATYHGLMDGKAEYWDSFAGGFGVAAATAGPASLSSIHQLYTKEKPIMSKVNSSLALSANDIYKTDEDGKLIYDSNNKPQIDPTKQLSAIRGMNNALQIDQLQEEALKNNNGEAIKVLQAAKISSIVHDHLFKGDSVEAIENAINNSMTKKDYEQNKLSEFYSYEEFKDIKRNILDIAKDNYTAIYSNPLLKNNSAEFKQSIYHNSVQQDLVTKELDKYSNQLENLKNKEEKLNSLQKEEKKSLESKIESLKTYKTELIKAYDKFTSNKTADTKITEEETNAQEVAQDFKNGKTEEEILKNKTGKTKVQAIEVIEQLKNEEYVKKLNTLSSLDEFESEKASNPDKADLIDKIKYEKIKGQKTDTNGKISEVTKPVDLLERYGQENELLRQHEEKGIARAFRKILENDPEFFQELQHIEAKKADPNYQYTPNPKFKNLTEHIAKGGTEESYINSLDPETVKDKIDDPIFQRAIDNFNGKETKVEEEEEEEFENPEEDDENPSTIPVTPIPDVNIPVETGSPDNTTSLLTVDNNHSETIGGKEGHKYVDIEVWENNAPTGTILTLTHAEVKELFHSSKVKELIKIAKSKNPNLSDNLTFKKRIVNNYLGYDNKDTVHVVNNVLQPGDKIYYKIPSKGWNEGAGIDEGNFGLYMVAYVLNDTIVEKDTPNAKEVIVGHVRSNGNIQSKDIDKILRKNLYSKWDKKTDFISEPVPVKGIHKKASLHVGKFRAVTREDIANNEFDVVITDFEKTSSLVENYRFANSKFSPKESSDGKGKVENFIQRQLGKVFMFLPSTNKNGKEEFIPVELETKKVKEVTSYKKKLVQALNDIANAPVDQVNDIVRKKWAQIIGISKGELGILRYRTPDSSFDRENKTDINPDGGLGPVITYYTPSGIDYLTKEGYENASKLLPGFAISTKGKKGEYKIEYGLSVDQVVAKLGEVRVHVPSHNTKDFLLEHPDLVSTDLKTIDEGYYEQGEVYIDVERTSTKEDIVNENVKEVLDRLTLLDEKTLKVNASKTEYVNEEDPSDTYNRISDLESNIAGVPKQPLSEASERSANRGTIIDTLFRKMVSREITSFDQFVKEYNSHPDKLATSKFSEKFLKELYPILTTRMNLLEKNFHLISNTRTLWGEINGVKYAGTIDLLAISKKDGKVYIIDLKTSVNDSRTDVNHKFYNKQRTSDSFQQSGYASLFTQRTGLPVAGTFILPVKTVLDSTTDNYVSAPPVKTSNNSFIIELPYIDSIYDYNVNINTQPVQSTRAVEQSKIDALKAELENDTEVPEGNFFAKYTDDITTVEEFKEGAAEKYIKDRFENLGVKVSDEALRIISNIYNVGDGKVWGAFYNAVVYLSSDAGLNVGKHEAFHVAFNLFLNDKQRKQVLNEAYKKYGKELGITKEEFENDLNKPIDSNRFKVEDQVDYVLKAVDILQSEKAKQIFNKGRKNNWSLDKILTELAIPKEQKELIEQIEQDFVQKQFAIYDEPLQYALELASNYSYTVEINTAKTKITQDGTIRNQFNEVVDPETGDVYSGIDNESKPFIEQNSQIYSNLTVPGGTNYTENEIAIPGVEVEEKSNYRVSLGSELPTTDKYGVFGEPTVKKFEVLDENKKVIGDVTLNIATDGSITLHPNLIIKGKGYGQELYKLISLKYNAVVKEFGPHPISKSPEAKKMWDSFEKQGLTSNYQFDDDISIRSIKINPKTVRKGAITPSIKGHAQFATDNGIGWFRSDDKAPQIKGWQKDEVDWMDSESAVYNAITPNDKIIWGHPTIGKSFLKEKGDNSFITLDDDYANEVNAFIDKNRGNQTRQEYKGSKPKEYNKFMLDLFDRLKIQAKKEGKKLFVSNTNILKERMSEFDKVITMPKDEFKKRFDKRGSTYGFEDWKSDIDKTVDKVDSNKVIETTKYLSDLLEPQVKTRRILEVQSDLFQKWRNNFEFEGNRYTAKKDDKNVWHYYKNGNEINANEYTKTWETFLDTYLDNADAFTKLLQKDNNWVTFFVKSIIQDSAKKGYEKVLFPSGNTASKVEGHTTLEEFKKQKEDRIKELEKQTYSNFKSFNIEATHYMTKDNKFYKQDTTKDLSKIEITEKEYKEAEKERIKEKLDNSQKEIEQLKQELERVETEGFGALKPIYNFYENTVTNILKKNYTVNKITDEYGNTWNEIAIIPELVTNNIKLKTEENSFYQKQSILIRLEEKLANAFEDYKYTGVLSDNFKKNYPEISKFLEKIFKFLLDQYHMLKGYLTDSLTINDIFYQLDNNIFGKGYDGKRRKSYQETFSRNLLEIYGEEAKFKLKGVDTINLRKYSKFIVTNIFTNLLPPVKDKSGVPRKVSWLTDVLKDNKDASSLINDLFKKLPAEINRRITNAKTDEIKKSMEEIKSILNEDRFKWEILAQVKEITGYGFTPIEENNNEDVDDDTSDEISDPTGEYSESNIVKKDNQQDPKNNIKGKLRELLNKIVKYDLKNNLPLIDPTTGGFVYYEFNEVSNRLYHYLPDSLNEKDMWNRILELSESFEDIWFIRNQIETASKQRNQDIYDTDLFNKLWLKFGGQRKINYSFAINNNDGTVNVKNSTKHRVHDNILTEVRNYIELQNRKVDAPEVNIDNLFQLFNVYGLYISKADIAKLNEKEIVKAINAFTNFEKYISNGGNPFTFELNKTPEIVSANNLVELVVKYSPNLADNVIYTIHGKKEFIVQMNNFLTKTLNQFKNNNKEFRNKFKNTILHSKLPIYDLTETDISKWEIHYNNGFIQQGKKKGTEYSKFTLKELISQNINFAFSDVNSKTMKVMLPIFSDATSHAYINVNKLTPDIIIMQMAKTAIAELERIKFSLNNKTGYENFDKNGKHFLLLPFLEKHKEKLLEFNINDPLLSSHLESLIEPVIKKQFADYTNKLIKLGVLDKIVTVNEAKVKLEKIVAGTGVTSRINESDALDRVREYFYNQYYYNTQFIPLFAGDPAFYKPNKKNKNDTNPEMSVSIDFLKRFKEVHSPTTHGLYKDINGKPKSTKNLLYLYDIYKPSTDEFIDGIAYLNDIPSNIVDTYKKEVRNIYSETKEELTEEEKDLKKKYPNDFSYLHNFSQNNLTDAQKLNNPEFTLMVMEAHDKISPEQRKILREQINNNLATDVTLEVLKPFVFSHEFISLNESSNLLRPFQEKNSEFTLLPNVAYLTKDKTFEIPTKDINWDNYVFPTKAKLLWIMQGKGNPENAIDGISFESATKVDKDTRNLLSIDDVLNMDNDLTSNVVTSSMEGYGLSNEVPADKQIDKNIDLGSQIKVLITEGLKESLTINGITYNPESLLNEFQDLHIKGHREQFKKLKDKTSTAEKTIAILKEAAIKLGKSISTIMGYNKNVDGKPDIPLELDATSNQHMLNSLTKKTVSESGPGGTFVNVSSVSIDDLAIKWKKDKAGKVIGIDHIECAAAINSPYIDALVDKNGIVTVEDVQAAYGEEVTDKLLSMVAYRIPTEDKYSMYPLKIKYILPRSSGAALMLPKEATSITGLDFDVDKMFFIKYAFEIESNFSKYLGHVNDIIGNSSVQDGETISNGLVDPETGNPYVLTTNKFKELFNKALNEDVGLTIEEDAIIEHFKDNMNEYKELLDTKNIKVIPSSYDTSSSRHNFKLDIMLAIAQTTSFARSFTHPGSSSILAREIELFSSPKYSNYDIIEDESTAQVTLPDVQDENAKKANIGGASIGIFANANKHHAIIEYAQLELKKIFNFSNKQYDSIGKRKSEDGKFIKDITASLLFASTEHIKTPLMDKLNIDLDNVNALLAGIRLGIPFHDLMVLINQPVIKDTLKKFPNSTKLVPELNNELSILALQNQIDLNSVQKSDITIAELETMFNPKGLSNKVITRENLIALNKFIELATIGEELFQIQINTKFDTSNQFGPELLDNQFKLQRLEYLYDKLSINSVFKNFDDIVPRVTYNKANQEWTLAPSKLRLNDSYIQIMVDQLNHFKNNFSFLSDSFIKLQYLIKDLSNQDHFYPYQIKKINGEIYNAVAQGTLNNIADIITNIPTEWATIRYKTKEQYMPFLNALTREIVFGKPVLRLYDNVIVGNALSDKYKDIFEDMLADPDTKVFAERLAVYAYFTSGFKFTPRGFSRFVPNTFLLENEQGKKIRDLYNNFDINKSNLNSDEIAELIIYNNPSLVTSINIKEHVDNVVIKPTSHGQLPSSFIIKEDNESLYVDKFGNPNRFLSYTVYIAVGGESVPLEMLFESTGNIRGYYSAVNLPGNSKIFSNYTGVDLGFYPDIAPTTIELNSNEISEEIQTMPVKDLDTTISYYEGNITPEPNTIFVFGSNPEGRHGKGAALTAVQQFGAKYGQGEGLQGNAYALPTKDLRVKENNGFKSISPKQITESIVKLYKVAKQNPNKEFKIAYKNTTEKSLNGYTGLEMIDMFNNAGRIPLNIVFSKEWIDTDKLKQPQNISVKDINNLPDIDIDIKNEKCK